MLRSLPLENFSYWPLIVSGKFLIQAEMKMAETLKADLNHIC